MSELAIIVPTRGRPGNIEKVISAWDFTNAWDVADLWLAVDLDDPEIQGYRVLLEKFYQAFDNEMAPGSMPLQIIETPTWVPMVHKLDAAARALATGYWALGFAGDDHLPRTIGWAQSYLAAIKELKTGLVYGDDGYQGEKLCTEWAMTSDVVQALGRMVPAPVEHLYSDVSVLDVFKAANAVKYLPQTRIEHMHPAAHKADSDDQYQRVNHRDQYRKDGRAYEAWKADPQGMASDVAAVRALQPDRPVPAVPAARRSRRTVEPKNAAWGTGKVIRSAPRAPTKRKVSAVNFPRDIRRMTPKHLRHVQSLTPPEIGVTLADFARQVSPDHAIVEIGVHHGYTALMMAWGAREGQGAHVWAFDPWDMPGNVYAGILDSRSAKHWARYNVRSTGNSNRVTLVQATSAQAALDWPRQVGLLIGLLYVDGAHEYDAARADILAWLPHLAPGAVIAVDDYNDVYRDHVVKAVDDLVAEGYLAPVELFHNRLAVTKAGNRMTDAETPPEVPQGVAEAAAPHGVTAQDNGTVMVENEPATEPPRDSVQEGELSGEDIKAGTPIDRLNIAHLKMLAKERKITLGKRKDKRSEIIQALKDGR